MGAHRWHSLPNRLTLAVVTILMVGLWSLSLWLSNSLHGDIEALLSEQQMMTATSAAVTLDEQLKDRLEALEKVSAKIPATMMGDAVALQSFINQLTTLQLLFNGGVFVCDTEGLAIADYPAERARHGNNYLDRPFIAKALHGQSSIGEPTFSKAMKNPIVGMATPIRDAHGGIVGTLAGVIDLDKPNFLDRMKSWQGEQKGDILLVAPQKRIIVTATDKRRVFEQLPPAGVLPVMDRFINGDEGNAIFVNPRGVEVLVSVKRVPIVGWYVAVILPTTEAFSPVS